MQQTLDQKNLKPRNRIVIIEPEDRVLDRDKKYIQNIFWVIFAVGLFVLIVRGLFYQPKPTSSQKQVPLPSFQIESGVGIPEIFSIAENRWIPLRFGEAAPAGTKIRTDNHSQVDLKLEKDAFLRLKSNSAIVPLKMPLSSEPKINLRLTEGELLGAIEKDKNSISQLFLSTPQFQTTSHKARFLLRSDPVTQTSWLGVMEGEMILEKKELSPFKVSASQKIEVTTDDHVLQTQSLTEEDWKLIYETYALNAKNHLSHQKELWPSLGSFFSRIQSIENYYLEEAPGFSSIEISKSKDEQDSFFSFFYDVFPEKSVAGITFNITPLDLKQFESFEFEVKKNPKEASPETITLQLKSGNFVLKKFHLKNFIDEWRRISLPFQGSNQTPITSFDILFSHAHVGKETKGRLYFKNFELKQLKIIQNQSQPSSQIATKKTEEKLTKSHATESSPKTADELDLLVSRLQNLNQILTQTSLLETQEPSTSVSPS